MSEKRFFAVLCVDRPRTTSIITIGADGLDCVPLAEAKRLLKQAFRREMENDSRYYYLVSCIIGLDGLEAWRQLSPNSYSDFREALHTLAKSRVEVLNVEII